MVAQGPAEVPAVSGRTVHRGPQVRPGGGDVEQVHHRKDLMGNEGGL